MSADGDFIRSARGVAEAIIKKVEDGDVELSEVPDLFKKAGAWLRIQDQQRNEWLFGHTSLSPEAQALRTEIEGELSEELFGEVGV